MVNVCNGLTVTFVTLEVLSVLVAERPQVGLGSGRVEKLGDEKGGFVNGSMIVRDLERKFPAVPAIMGIWVELGLHWEEAERRRTFPWSLG